MLRRLVSTMIARHSKMLHPLVNVRVPEPVRFSEKFRIFKKLNLKATSDKSLSATIKMSKLDSNESDTSDTSKLHPDEQSVGEVESELRRSYAEAKKNSHSKWIDYMGSCYVYIYRGGGEPSNNIAAFDLDGTIIKPKSNKRIPKSATDWQFFSVWTKVKLETILRTNKARFVIFTNQNGVGLKIVPLEEVQKRIELVAARLNIPCIVLVAIDQNEFRKPKTGMYRLFEDLFNDSLPVDLNDSFYCGDAVGYPSHSDADIKFAETIGIPFLKPEQFLRGVKPKIVPRQGQSATG